MIHSVDNRWWRKCRDVDVWGKKVSEIETTCWCTAERTENFHQISLSWSSNRLINEMPLEKGKGQRRIVFELSPYGTRDGTSMADVILNFVCGEGGWMEILTQKAAQKCLFTFFSMTNVLKANLNLKNAVLKSAADANWPKSAVVCHFEIIQHQTAIEANWRACRESL